MAKRWQRFAQLTKFDAFTGEFEAVMTDETVDGVNEVMDYETSKPYIQEWSGFFDKATAGESVGNVREMHGLKAAGKLLAIDFDDERRAVPIRGKAVDTEVRKKLAEGVYTGVSIGGDYVKRWDDPAQPGITRYTAKPVEVSLVDYPCNPSATFTLVRTKGGHPVMRKFANPKKVYASVADLPAAQVKGMSTHEKHIFLEAFNNAFKEYDGDESKAFATAHAAVNKEHGEKSLRDSLDKLRARFAEAKKSHWPIGALASFAEQLEWMAQNAEANEHADVCEELEALRGEVLAVLETAAAGEAAEHSDSEGDMDAAKAKKIEEQLAALEKEIGVGALHKADDGDANAHAEFKAKHHEKLAELHTKMAEHYTAGAKGAHDAEDDGDDKTKNATRAAAALKLLMGTDADRVQKAAAALAGTDPNVVTKEDLKAFAAELVRNIFGPGSQVPLRTDPAALKAQGAKPVEVPEVKTGDDAVDAKFKDPTVAFIRGRMTRPMVFQTPGELGYRNRDLLRR